MTLKSMGFNDVAIVTVERNHYRILATWMKVWSWIEWKKLICWIIIVMSNNTPETMVRQQRYREENKEKIKEISKPYPESEDNQKFLQRMNRDQYRGFCEERKK